MTKTIRLFAFAVILIGGLFAFGCQPKVDESPAETATPTRVSTPRPITPKFACGDKLGCIDIALNEPIHLAYALATTGTNAPFGLDAKYGAELAIDDAPQVLGHALQFDGQDSGCTLAGGQSAAAKLAADKTIVAIIGGSCSSDTRPLASALLNSNGSVMISPSAVAPDLADPAKYVPGSFRTAYNDQSQSAVAAEFVYKQLKLTKIATINDGTAYTQALTNKFTDSFKKLGGTITAQEAVQVGNKDVRTALTRIASTKPDLIYYPIFETEGSLICSQVRDVPGLEKTAMMGADGIVSPSFTKVCGKNAAGMFWSMPDLNFGGDYATLANKYLKKYNVAQTQSVFHAQAYDAVNMVLAALAKPGVVVKDADGTLHVQKQALRDAIATTKNFKGLTGNLSCDAYGDCADPKIAIYRFIADNQSNTPIPNTPVWFPGGPDYKP